VPIHVKLTRTAAIVVRSRWAAVVVLVEARRVSGSSKVVIESPEENLRAQSAILAERARSPDFCELCG
jgi:hypothetical protein